MRKKTLLTAAVFAMLPVMTWGFDFVKNGKALAGVDLKSNEKGVRSSSTFTEQTS